MGTRRAFVPKTRAVPKTAHWSASRAHLEDFGVEIYGEEAVKYGQVVDLARLAGFEPTTPAFGGQYSIQLSYRRVDIFPLRMSAR